MLSTFSFNSSKNESLLSFLELAWGDIEVVLESAWEHVYANYFDVYYLGWLVTIFYPLVLTFILPAIILLMAYTSALFLHIYRLRHLWVTTSLSWDGARRFLCAIWAAQGNLWHGHEVIGFENIPKSGPALLIFYHGALPVDIYYVICKCILLKGRHIHTVGDRFLFKIPGFKILVDLFHVMPGTVSKGVELMQQGHLLAIAPGGVREALFGDEYYQMLWGNRTGFAKIALEAKVPVIPVFTQNCREAFRTVGLFRNCFRWLYEKTRLPLVPIYGGFPVKLRTFIGTPIVPKLGTMAPTPEQLSAEVRCAIQALIKQHQRIPGNIFRALLDRFG